MQWNLIFKNCDYSHSPALKHVPKKAMLLPSRSITQDYAVVGLSNFPLDAAKMNRAIALVRPPPPESDLVKTANAICYMAPFVHTSAYMYVHLREKDYGPYATLYYHVIYVCSTIRERCYRHLP